MLWLRPWYPDVLDVSMASFIMQAARPGAPGGWDMSQGEWTPLAVQLGLLDGSLVGFCVCGRRIAG
jgi:hypothetical protein